MKYIAKNADARPRSIGNFYARNTKNGIVVQKWPRKRGKAKTPYDFYRQTEFGIAAQWASDPEPVALQTAMNLTAESQQVPRDVLMQAQYGLFYEITFTDGTPVEYYRVVAPNSQLVLDQVTSTPGAMLYRSPMGWVEIPPGSNGYVLTEDAAVPKWKAPTGGAGPPPLPALWQGVDFNASSTTTFGVTQGVSLPIEAAVIITGCAVYCRTAAPTCKLTPVLYGTTTNVPGPRLALGPQVTGVVQGINLLPFTTPYTTLARGMFNIGCAIDVAGFAQPSSNGTIASWNMPTTPPPNPAPTISNGFIISWLKCWAY